MSRSLVVWTLGAAVIGALLLFGFHGGAEATTWKLINTVSLDCRGGDNIASTADDSCSSAGLGAKALSATADLDSQFKVEVGHTNYNKVDTMVSSPSFNVALDSSIPNGAAVGTLITTATLSIVNGPCVSGIPVNLPLFDASTDVTNTIDWVGDGSNWSTDSDGNGLADAIDKYPSALNKVYNSQRPVARYYGYTAVQPGAPPSQLNMIIFPPGVVAGTTATPGLARPEQELNGSVGYVTMIQLDNPDPTAVGSVSSITDFCTPLDVTARLWGKTQGEGRSIPIAGGSGELSAQCSGANLGLDNDGDTVPDDGCIVITDKCSDSIDNDGDTKVNEYCVGTTGLYAARARVTNPSSATSGIYSTGTHILGAYSQGNRDADADGIENGLDSCPTIADGRESGAACAPGNVADEDGDTKVNDGCPRIGPPELFPSPDQCADAADNDGDTLANDGCPPLQKDADADGLGDACDPTPAVANTDPDGDLFLNRQDNCPTTANADQADQDSNRCSLAVNDDTPDDTRVNDGCPAVGAKETACTDTTDNDGDTFVNDGCPLMGAISEFCVNSDFGTCGDSIGTVCDANPTVPDGSFSSDFPRSAVCIGAADADSDGWCDATETLLGSNTASATSVPEYKGLDYPMTTVAPGSCSNMLWYASAGDPIGNGAAVDDDGDTLVNAADAGCGVIASDTDQDGVPDATDNCLSVYNPDQTNSDTIATGGGDALGDACDPNDDGDGLIDTAEWVRGSDAKNPFSPFMLDIDGNTSVQGADASALKAWIGTSIATVPAPSQVCLP